jgi:hypothetical protein
MSAPEIVVVESEAKSDSEEDTCFGLVYEKMADAIETTRENPYPKGIKLMSEREADDSEGETDKTTGADKEIPVAIQYEGKPWKDMRNTIVLITETEATEVQTSDQEEDDVPVSQLLNRQKEASVSETAVGMKVAKHFDSGLFVGEITAVTGKRGRSLYTVLYEDGDGEDLNEREFKEARVLYQDKDGKATLNKTALLDTEEIEGETAYSGGETEGSDFAPSEDELEKKRARKKNKTLRTPEKEKEKTKGRKQLKEADEKKSRGKHAIIDVEALLNSGSKDNITNKTVALMTPEEAESLTTNAGKSILKEAKKGLRVQAFKVGVIILLCEFLPCLTLISLYRRNIQTWSAMRKNPASKVCGSVWRT